MNNVTGTVTTFWQELEAAIARNDSLLCVGLDPQPENIPPQYGSMGAFTRAIIDATADLACAYKPNIAFYEAINESKLTTDLIYRYGMAGMLERISNTAAYGAITIGPEIVDEHVKDKIRQAVEKIKNGGFDRDWEQDYKEGYPKFRRLLEELRNSQAEQVGDEIRRRRSTREEGELTVKNW